MEETGLTGDRLRARRKALGLTQTQLAGLVGYSSDMIKKIESGHRRPAAELTARLQACLDPGAALPPAAPLTLGAWLRAQRAAHDLTQKDLAAQLHYSGSMIGKLEDHTHRPSVTLAEAIADRFAVPPAARAGFIQWARGVQAATAVAPPLPTAGVTPVVHLPAPLTSFVGRSLETAAVVARLRQPAVRLLTLTGPGGVGKTRLALAAGAAGAAAFPDGVWWVDLAPLHDPAQVLAEVTAALALPPELGRTPLLRLTSYLREKRLLLILDNFEHLLPAAASLSTLLQSAAQLKVLVTSRRVLQLRGEHIYLVPPFARSPLFADGVVFVDLAQRPAPDLLPLIAAALGVPETSTAPLLDQVVAFLRDRQLLLVLDNATATAGSDAGVIQLQARLVHAAPGVTLLCPLAAVAPPPVVPAGNPAPGLDLADEAALLFMARAQAVCPDLVCTAELLPVLAAINARLDGLPLALELAAARSKQFPPRVLLQRLHQRLGVLTSSAPDVPARQQTMRATIAWSYDLLDPALQRLFALCAVFAGSWTADAVGAVEGISALPVANGETLADALHELADHSLIYRVPTAAGAGRFTMLATIREYASAVFADRPEADGWRQRHAGYYLSQMETLVAQLDGAAQSGVLAHIAQDYENAWVVLTAGITSGDPILAARMTATLWPFWQLRGYWSEGRQWLDALAAQGDWPPALHARLTEGAGVLALQQGAVAEADGWLTQSGRLYQQVGDPRGEARTLTQLGTVARLQSDWSTATTRLQASQAAFARLHDLPGCASALYNLGSLARTQGDFATAHEYYQESLTIYRQLADPSGIARLLLSLATTLRTLDGPVAALPLLEESLALYQRLEQPVGQAAVLTTLGVTLRLQGDRQRATALQQEALALNRRLGSTVSSGANLLNLGDLALDGEDWLAATAYFSESYRLFTACTHHGFTALSLLGLGDSARGQRAWDQARQYYAQGCDVAEASANWQEVAGCQWGLGMVAQQTGAFAEARAHYQTSLRVAHRLNDAVGLVRSVIALAHIALATGERTWAARLCGGLALHQATLASRSLPQDRAAYAELQVACAADAAALHTGQLAGWDSVLAEALVVYLEP